MSEAWGPSPLRSARSGAFRDTSIIAALAVAGVVGLVVWDGGGDATGGTELDGTPPATVSDAPSTPNPSDPVAPAAMVAAQDELISVLPAPAGGTEVTPVVAGVRRWTFAGTDWPSIRDAYVGTLRQQGFTVELQGPTTEGASGERYTLSDRSGTVAIALAVATQDGQSMIEVRRQ